MSEGILVVGGTGMLGEPVARRLLADGKRVRILSRTPEKVRARLGSDFELVAGDVDDVASLERAVKGCHGVHINLDGGADADLERRGAANVARAASAAGLERITYISGASVSQANAWFPGTRAKLAAEKAIADCGVPFTVFRPTFFMDALPRYVRGPRASVIGRQPRPWHWVAASDYASMVSRAFASTDAVGKALYVYGPEAMTTFDALTRYCEVAHPEAKVSTLPMWGAALIARLTHDDDLAARLPFFRYVEKVREEGDPAETNALFGAPGTTLRQWSESRVAAGVAA